MWFQARLQTNSRPAVRDGKPARSSWIRRYGGGDGRVGPPPVAAGHQLIYDPTLGGVVAVSGEMWSLTGNRWRMLSEGPEPRDPPAVAFDSARNRLVLYSGFPYDDTWEWDDQGWREVLASSPPGTISNHSMAYDAARAEVVMVARRVTWSWDGVSWTQRSAAGAGPDADGLMAFDAARGEVLLQTGRTWAWDGSSWTERATAGPRPAAPSFGLSAAMAYDPVRQRVVWFGGGPSSSTWEWDGSGWAKARPATMPLGRSGFGMAYDPTLQKIVIAGGQSNPSFPALASWSWDGVAWSQLANITNPFGRVALATDTNQSRLVGVETARYSNGTHGSTRTWQFRVFPPAATAHFGTWCGGLVDPHVEPFGLPRLGRVSFAVDVGRVASGAPGGLLLAASSAQFQLAPGCTLWVDPATAVALPFVAGATGFVSLPLPVPASIAPGALHAQAIVVDPGGPWGGLSMSRGLTLTIGQ